MRWGHIEEVEQGIEPTLPRHTVKAVGHPEGRDHGECGNASQAECPPDRSGAVMDEGPVERWGDKTGVRAA